MKLKHLGVKSKPSPTAMTKESPKVVESFPDVTLTSRQVEGLKDYAEQGKRCNLHFEGEVTGFRSADEWHIRDGNMKKGDVSVTFKLSKGAIETKKPKSLNEAAHMINEEYS